MPTCWIHELLHRSNPHGHHSLWVHKVTGFIQGVGSNRLVIWPRGIELDQQLSCSGYFPLCHDDGLGDTELVGMAIFRPVSSHL